jgi:hypothetical protein
MRHSKLWLVSIFIVGSLFLSACTAAPFQVGSRDVVTQEMEFSDFNEVEVSDAFTVQIRQGDEYRVTIEVDEATLDYLEVNQRGDTLEIGLRPRTFFLFWIWNSTQRAEITMPNLVGIRARDASKIDVSGFNTDGEVRIEVSDASSLEGEIASGDARLRVSDASEVDLEGNRQNVEIEASDASKVRLTGEGQDATIRARDASKIDLSDFPLRDVSIEASDASNVTVDVSGTLDVEASDASRVVYYGTPTMGNTSSSDGSSITGRDR